MKHHSNIHIRVVNYQNDAFHLFIQLHRTVLALFNIVSFEQAVKLNNLPLDDAVTKLRARKKPFQRTQEQRVKKNHYNFSMTACWFMTSKWTTSCNNRCDSLQLLAWAKLFLYFILILRCFYNLYIHAVFLAKNLPIATPSDVVLFSVSVSL